MWETEYREKEVHKLVADRLIPLVEVGGIFALIGSMGVGKTVLVRECLVQLGVDVPVTSPTFSYLNEYILPGGLKVYHFDLYRITSLDDFMAMGFSELFGEKETIFFIEWPECISEFLDKLSLYRKVHRILLNYGTSKDHSRVISCDLW